MKIKAIIFGATGMVGEGVLLQALNHPDVESVLVVGRRACGITHSKLKEVIHTDFYNFQSIEEQLTGYNTCFFCLGVSSIGMNETDYTRVTYDLTMSAAKTLSRLNSEMTFCYVSGQGTDSSENGKLMWARVKGKTENDLTKLPFKAVYLFRPGFIKPSANQKRAFKASKVIGIIYPILKVLLPKYVCTMDELGMAMINVSKSGYERKVLENKDIVKAASEK
ncbi:MAG: epimerase [Ignavibacteriales bacterium]|nr:epimerase [Ignavibacteriales bacterium]